MCGVRGYDGGKKMSGRKRRLLGSSDLTATPWRSRQQSAADVDEAGAARKNNTRRMNTRSSGIHARPARPGGRGGRSGRYCATSHHSWRASSIQLMPGACRRAGRSCSKPKAVLLAVGVAASASSSRCIYGCNALRCPSCLRHPYRVMPRGLYTFSTRITTNTTVPPTEWTSVLPSARRSSPDVVGSAAMSAK